MTALGANLRQARTELGFTLVRLARRSGVPREVLAGIEAGRVAACIDVVWKLSGALGLPFSALVVPRADGPPTASRGGGGAPAPAPRDRSPPAAGARRRTQRKAR